MIGFAESFLAWLASTLIPAFVGLFLIVWAGRRIRSKYLVCFAFGIFFWFFVDTIGGSGSLDVNSGCIPRLQCDYVAQIATVGLFLLGIVVFFGADRNRNIFAPESAVGKYGMVIPVFMAVALGIHGLGEGASYGYTVYTTSLTSLLDAFGGVYAGVAYVLHKALEPMMIGASYLAFTSRRGRGQTRQIKDVFLLSVIFAIPSLIGNPVGYFIMGPATGYLLGFNTTYFYALGTGTSIYAAFRLAAPLFVNRDTVTSREPLKMTISWILGIMAIYIAALFHS